MHPASPLNLWEHEALLYQTKTFEYNRYPIDHPDVKGILRLATMPVDVIRVDKSRVPQGFTPADDNEYIVSTTTAVMFVNRGEKKTPTEITDDMSSHKMISVLQYAVTKQTDEPWCECVVQDRPGELLRIRTILTDAYYYPGLIASIGGPYLTARHTVSIAVTDNAAPESGVT